jgi:hypothetical protein
MAVCDALSTELLLWHIALLALATTHMAEVNLLFACSSFLIDFPKGQ